MPRAAASSLQRQADAVADLTRNLHRLNTSSQRQADTTAIHLPDDIAPLQAADTAAGTAPHWALSPMTAAGDRLQAKGAELQERLQACRLAEERRNTARKQDMLADSREAELAGFREGHSQALRHLQQGHEAEVGALRASNRRLEGRLAAREEEHSRQLADLQAVADLTHGDLEAECAARMAAAEAAYAAQWADAQAQHDAAMREHITSTSRRMEELHAGYVLMHACVRACVRRCSCVCVP